jgi:2-alkenal reductase
MGWIHDDFDPDPNDERDAPGSTRERLTGFFIGLAVGALTLVLIAALIVTTVGTYFLGGETETARPSLRSVAPPSEADLRAANYRPSEWVEVDTRQTVTPTPLPAEIIAQADAEHALLTNIYLRVNPSVVNIEIVSSVHTTVDVVDSSGSGFVYDADGHIVTNAHVVRDAREILVTFSDGHVLSAELVAVDDYSDLAVIRVDPARAPLVPVLLGDSNQLQVGQRVIAIGNPFGLDGSMTVGIVSALGRSLPSARLLDPAYDQYSNPSIIQVDAAVNPGNSGGPLLDSYGQVIGINTAIRTENGGFQGIAFAVPVNTMKRIVPQLIEQGSVQYSWLGITSPAAEGGYSVAALADELNLPVRNGILVSEVTPGSPAARAGLRAGTQTTTIRGVPIPVDSDIIVAVNGQMIRDIDSLVAYLVENTSPGDTITLTIVRAGQTLDLDVTLGTRP